jgi:hypothetical protein
MRCGRCLGRPGSTRFTCPPSIHGGKTRASCRWPGVTTRGISLPPPSARRWTLGLKPPRLRPKASVSGALFGPSRVLMGSDHGAIEIMEVPVDLALGVGLRLHRRQELTPDASLLPAVEATGHGTPQAIAFGQIPPGSPGAQNPENPVENAALIDGRPTGLRFVGGEQRLQPLPWRMGSISSVHPHPYNDVNRVCKHDLAIIYTDGRAFRQ